MEYREERPEWTVEARESFSEKTCERRTAESDPRRKSRSSLQNCPSSNSSSSKEECQSLCASVRNDAFQEARKVETQVEETNGQSTEEDEEAKFIISLTNMLPKYVDEIPPNFAGLHDKRKVSTWIFKVEHYLDMIKVKTDRLRINIATAFFNAFAAEWWQNRMNDSRAGQESPIVSWEQFVKLMEQTFIPTEARVDTQVQKLEEVLTQTETIPVYIMAFLSRAKQLENSNEADKVSQFIQGLKPKPSAYVRTYTPSTLAEAINLAEKWDQANSKQAPFTPYEKRTILRRTSQKKAISKPDRPHLHEADRNIQYSHFKSRRLSEYEKNEYRKRGLCFKCGEHGHTFYQCSQRR
jgi:hypothetical protein